MSATIGKGFGLEYKTALELLNRGCEVFLPLTHQTEADLVVFTLDHKSLRIQVKSVYEGNRGNPKNRSQLYGPTYRNNNGCGTRKKYETIDFFVFWHRDIAWIVPREATGDKWAIILDRCPAFKNSWHLITGCNDFNVNCEIEKQASFSYSED